MVPGASWHCLRTFQLPYCVLVHMLTQQANMKPVSRIWPFHCLCAAPLDWSHLIGLLQLIGLCPTTDNCNRDSDWVKREATGPKVYARMDFLVFTETEDIVRFLQWSFRWRSCILGLSYFLEISLNSKWGGGFSPHQLIGPPDAYLWFFLTNSRSP